MTGYLRQEAGRDSWAILPQSNFHVKIIFELLTCPCKQFIKLAVHVCRIAEINLQMS